ncbi:MAG: hypothetical protein IPL53_01270 [Ignavibacteria bacterium]|nr:hypothetical protein [Ignavibacteria bacterium]
MKNKTVISFCINILVGVLFSFPVFSTQSNNNILYPDKSEFNIQDVKDSQQITNVPGSSSKYYPESTKNSIYQYKFFGNSNSGNKEKTEFKQSNTRFKEFFKLNIFLSLIYLNPIFVNLSYLKDLRTTKMLC